mgnify:CR=1 FL=1
MAPMAFKAVGGTDASVARNADSRAILPRQWGPRMTSKPATGASVGAASHGAPPDAAAIASRVNAVLVNMVYERLSTSVLLSLVCCILFGSLLAPFFPPGRMIGWVLVMAVVSGGRLLLWRGFMARRPTGAALASWDRWFTVWSMAAGASWAYGPVMLMPAAGRSESLLLMGALLCVCSVAAITQAARMVSMLAFLLAALPPAAWSLAQTGGSVEKIAALEVLVGMLALMLVGRRSHRTICAAVQTELELSQTVRQLDLAREHAESASVAKTRFLANMSHELRSPLNAVIGAAQLMKFGTEDPTEGGSTQRHAARLGLETAWDDSELSSFVSVCSRTFETLESNSSTISIGSPARLCSKEAGAVLPGARQRAVAPGRASSGRRRAVRGRDGKASHGCLQAC